MKVSVAILNYKEKGLTDHLVSSIKKCKFPKKQFEIIVVDNASNDGSVEFLRKKHKDIRVIESRKNMGYPGLNLAVAAARGEYLLFLNNDMEATEDCIKVMYDFLENNPNITAVVPRLVNFFKRTQVDFAGEWISRSFYAGELFHWKKPKTITGVGVGLMRLQAIKELGYLYDTDFFLYGEDIDLGFRMRLAGMKAVFLPQAVFYHMESATTRKVQKTKKCIYYSERNLIMTYIKNVDTFHLWLYAPYVLAARVASVIRDAIRLNFSSLHARLQAYLWIIQRPRFLYRKRKINQKIRSKRDRFVLRPLTEKYILRELFPFLK